MEEAPRPARPANRFGWSVSRGDLIFVLAVAAAYVGMNLVELKLHPSVTGSWPDRMYVLAQRILAGHLDSPQFAYTVDSVARDGRYYIAVGPLQVVPYLPLAPFGVFRNLAGFITSGAFGLGAALASLKLVRSYGARGANAYWAATLAAFGTLLFYVSVLGNFYYLAQAESFLALSLFLIEWAGRRRPVVLGTCLAFSMLARPTTILAAIPFGLALIWRRRDWFGRGFALAVPVAVAIGIYGLFNWARFGSPTETGYAISFLPQPGLEARRELGLFSVLQVPENVRLAFLTGFKPLGHAPFFTADPYGLSMLLVSPGLLTAVWAGFQRVDARLLWIAAALVAAPVFLYYGGGYFQYGFRYTLDFTPFLVALVAMGTGRWRGWPERLLISVSVLSVGYGVLWAGISALRT
jgi:hypothetical protein